MTPPADKEIFKSQISTYWFDDGGILVSISNSTTRTIENIRENIALIKSISDNRLPCLLVYLTYSKKPDKATRDFVNAELPNLYKAMAIVSKSGIGEIVMNILFKLKPPVIPMKTFKDDAEAKKWLRQYL